MSGYRLLEHTADMGIEARGATLAELFVQAALGLREVLCGSAAPRPERWEEVTLCAGDREELLVDWLGEILYRLEVHGFLATGFVIARLTDTALTGRLGGVDFAPGRLRLAREVKAVTWHRLAVTGAPGAWQARLYLDL